MWRLVGAAYFIQNDGPRVAQSAKILENKEAGDEVCGAAKVGNRSTDSHTVPPWPSLFRLLLFSTLTCKYRMDVITWLTLPGHAA